MKHGHILVAVPVEGDQQTNANYTSEKQTETIQLGFTETKSHAFEWTAGFAITLGTQFSVGVPEVFDGTVKVDVSGSISHKWGDTTTDTKTFSATVAATAPPGKKVVAKAIITRSPIEVPFTIYSRSVKTGIEVQTYGTYKSVSFWGLVTKLEEYPL